PLVAVVGQLRAVAQVQFLPDPVAVGLDGLDAQVQSFGDLRGLHALADQTEYLQLAIGQDVERRVRDFFSATANGAVQHLLGHRVTQEHLPFQHPPDGFDDLVRGLVLVDVTQRSGPERTFGVERLAVHRPDQNADAVVAGLDPLDQVDPAAGLEGDIDDGQVGLSVGNQAQGLAYVGGLATDFQVGLPTDSRSQRVAHGRMVIDDHDPGRSSWGTRIRNYKTDRATIQYRQGKCIAWKYLR